MSFSRSKEPAFVRSPEGITLLMHAWRSDDRRVVDGLIAHGAEVATKDHAGRTALHHAAMNGAVQTVRALLAHRAELSDRTELEQTPLMLAAVKNPVCAQALLDAGAPLDFFSACCLGRIEAVRRMLEVEATLAEVHFAGFQRTTFHAYVNGHMDVVGALLAYRAPADPDLVELAASDPALAHLLGR